MKINYRVEMDRLNRSQNYPVWEVGDRVMLAKEVYHGDIEDVSRYDIKEGKIYHIQETKNKGKDGKFWDIYLKEFPGVNLINTSFINLDR